jgi:transcription elongation factor
MTAFDKFEVGDLVFSNEDHPHLDVEGDSPGIVTEVIEDSFGVQVEVAVEFHPDYNEVRFASHELTIVGRNGELVTFNDVEEGDLIMMVNPDSELVKFRVEDIFRKDNLVDVYGADVEDDLNTDSFVLSVDSDVFKVSA